MYTVENCDISGIFALESIAGAYRERGGDVFFVHVQRAVLERMRASGFYDYLGEDHFLDPDKAVSTLYHRVLDPAICVYECPLRAFGECQNLPKHLHHVHIDWETDEPPDTPTITPEALWQRLHDDEPLTVVDVREPREFAQGHVPGARLIPVPALLARADQIPRERAAVLVCRGGRRSRRAAAVLRRRGFESVTVLEGGMLAWEGANLLEAVGKDEDRNWHRGPAA
jgi:SulP family sulfate permease